MGKGIKTSRKRCPEEVVQKCIQRIQDGMTKYAACKKYGVPLSTIRYRLSGQWQNKISRGPRSVLTVAEEKTIVNWLTDMQERGFPVSRTTLKFKLNEFLASDPRTTPFKDGQPGRKWFDSFMRRNPGFSLRTPESISMANGRVSEADIRGWFSVTKDWLQKNDISEILLDASRVWNGDETSFYLHPKTREVIARKGSRNVYEIEQAPGKQNVTVMFSFSAAGAVVTPQVILPGQRVRKEVAEGFPPDWVIGVSDRGWMTGDIFAQYIQKDFHPFLIKQNVKFPVIFFVDGHISHKALEVADLCRSLDIVLISLYPNTTHITQPCDVAVFKPLKEEWRRVVEEWRLEHYGEVLTLPHFGGVLAKAVEQGIKQKTVINGFRVCGLFPFDADSVDYTKCLAHKRDASLAVAVNEAKEDQCYTADTAPVQVTPDETEPDTSMLIRCVSPVLSSQVISSPAIPTSFISKPEIPPPTILPSEIPPPSTQHVSISVDDIIQAVDMIGSQKMEKIQGDIANLNRDERIIRFFYHKFVRPYIDVSNSLLPDEGFGLIDRKRHEDPKIVSIENEGANDSAEFLHSNFIQEGSLIFEYELPSDTITSLPQIQPSERLVDESVQILAEKQTEDSSDGSCAHTSEMMISDVYTSPSNTIISPAECDEAPSSSLSRTEAITNRLKSISNDMQPEFVPNAFKSIGNINVNTNKTDQHMLRDISNTLQRKRKISLSDVFKLPPTPRRSGKHRNYTNKFHPVLTARERLEEIRKKEEEKIKNENEKKTRAIERKIAKIERENTKRINAEERKRKKLENEKKKREIKIKKTRIVKKK